MINHELLIQLPLPWTGQTFQTNHVGAINYLVGPNGSGKSRFANELAKSLRTGGRTTRLLGTDRLSEMAWTGSLRNYWGDQLATGLAKNQFDAFRAAGTQGSGIDTIVLLEERIDLRIQIEATLSHLFDRDITLEWDSGHLMPKVGRRGRQESYRFDREECHGIKELLVLLTNLYDEDNQYLVIDEPELNLHPQYQAFFVQEVRRIAGNPSDGSGKKIIFLITHSPFILDLQSTDDLESIISFDLEYSKPKQIGSLDVDISELSSLMPRLNAHHKQLFFSDNPIFVEGIYDAWLVGAMMEARGVSVAGAGSCIIDAGGTEKVNEYLSLCKGLGKQAHFVYDLDSLFSGRLKSHITSDQCIKTFLVDAGHGSRLDKYCGELEKKLTDLIDDILKKPTHPCLQSLVEFLRTFGAERSDWDKSCLPKARAAVVTAFSRHGDLIMQIADSKVTPSKEDLSDVQARLSQIVLALRNANVHLLPGGTIERYLPCYAGDHYVLSENAKRQAINAELTELHSLKTDADLLERYGNLYEAVCRLPSKPDVNVEPVLRNYLSIYIHELQRAIVNNGEWQLDQVQTHLGVVQKAVSDVFTITSLDRSEDRRFTATIQVAEMLGGGTRFVEISDATNAGMNDFDIVCPETPPQVNP